MTTHIVPFNGALKLILVLVTLRCWVIKKIVEIKGLKPNTPVFVVTPSMYNNHFRMGKVPPGNVKTFESIELIIFTRFSLLSRP